MIPELLIREIDFKFNCDILSKSRVRKNAFGRIAFGAVMRKKTMLSLDAIGKIINKDHATVLYYTKEHENLYKWDSDYKEKFDSLMMPIKSKRYLCKENQFKIKRHYERATV